MYTSFRPYVSCNVSFCKRPSPKCLLPTILVEFDRQNHSSDICVKECTKRTHMTHRNSDSTYFKWLLSRTLFQFKVLLGWHTKFPSWSVGLSFWTGRACMVRRRDVSAPTTTKVLGMIVLPGWGDHRTIHTDAVLPIPRWVLFGNHLTQRLPTTRSTSSLTTSVGLYSRSFCCCMWGRDSAKSRFGQGVSHCATRTFCKVFHPW